jgi:hypothetical protein
MQIEGTLLIIFVSLILIGIVIIGLVIWFHREKKQSAKKLKELRDAISGLKE